MHAAKLSKQQRTFRALHRQPVDQFPIFMSGTPQFMQKAMKCAPREATALQSFQYCVDLDLDVVQVSHPSFYPVKVMELPRGSTYVDDLRRTHVISEYYDDFCAPFPLQTTNKTDPDEIARNWKAYQFPDPKDPKWFVNLDAVIAANGKLEAPLSVWGTINGPLEPTWQLLSDGWPAFYILARRRPALALDVIEKMTDYVLAAGQAMIARGIHALRVSDDYALNAGLMTSVDIWKKFVYPSHCRLVRGLKKAGGADFPLILHSDGNIMALLDALGQSGLDAINPIQPDALDFGQVVNTIGHRLAITGAFDLRYFLQSNSLDQRKGMETETRRLFSIIDEYNKSQIAGHQTGFCIGPSHQVQPGSYPETFEAWVKIVHVVNHERAQHFEHR